MDVIIVKTGDNLFDKTNLQVHKGMIVENIGSGSNEEFVSFDDGTVLTMFGGDGISKPDIFRYQIKETIALYNIEPLIIYGLFPNEYQCLQYHNTNYTSRTY